MIRVPGTSGYVPRTSENPPGSSVGSDLDLVADLDRDPPLEVGHLTSAHHRDSNAADLAASPIRIPGSALTTPTANRLPLSSKSVISTTP